MGSDVRHLGNLGTEDEAKFNDDLAYGKVPVSKNFKPASSGRQLAEIREYYQDTNTYRVTPYGVSGDSTKGGGSPITVPRKVDNPMTMSVLEVGTVVVLDTLSGITFIDGVLMRGNRDTVENGTTPVTHMSANGETSRPNGTSAASSAGYFRYPGMPDDLVEGDWAHVTPDGNYIAALRKESRLFGSPMAQIRAVSGQDLLQSICAQLELWNSMGYLTMKNDGGLGKLQFKCAVDQMTQFGGTEEQWTFHLDIGAEGDMFNLRVTEPGGKTLSQIHLSADGRVEILGINGVTITNAGNAPRFEIDGGDVIKKVSGSKKEEVAGTVNFSSGSTRTSKISGDDKRVVGHNESLSCMNHQKINVGGKQEITVNGGGPDDAIPTNVAVFMKVINGSYVIDIGNPADTGIPSALAGYNVFVHSGAITLGQDPVALPDALTQVNLNSYLPDSIALGGLADPMSTNPALLHACVFEPLAGIFNTLLTMLDAHQHTVSGTSTTVQSTPPFSAALSSLVANIQSIRVLIGA